MSLKVPIFTITAAWTQWSGMQNSVVVPLGAGGDHPASPKRAASHTPGPPQRDKQMLGNCGCPLPPQGAAETAQSQRQTPTNFMSLTRNQVGTDLSSLSSIRFANVFSPSFTGTVYMPTMSKVTGMVPGGCGPFAFSSWISCRRCLVSRGAE